MQILVVVANIQMRTLKTEVEKGSMRTAIDHGLLDPKTLGNPNHGSLLPESKGNEVNIPQAEGGSNAVTQMSSETSA